MGFEVLGMTVIPILIYAYVESKWGMRSGIVAGMVLATLILGWLSLKMGEWDALTLFDLGLIYLLGGVSLYLKDSSFFRYQPAAIDFVSAIYVFVLQYLGTPFLVHAMTMSAKMGGRIPSVSSDWLSTVSLYFGLLFLFHGVAMVYLARVGTLKAWVLGRLSVYPLFFLLFFLSVAFVRGGPRPELGEMPMTAPGMDLPSP